MAAIPTRQDIKIQAQRTTAAAFPARKFCFVLEIILHSIGS